MKTHALQTERKKEDLLTPLMVSFFFTQFLFFLDEGYHDFRWMQSFGNWICFVIYWFCLFSGEVIVHTYLLKDKTTPAYVGLKHILGLFLGLTVAVSFFIGLKFLW